MIRALRNGHIEFTVGRVLKAALFFAGAVQKLTNPSAVMDLLAGFGLPGFFVWPAMIYNLIAAILLIANRFIRPIALSLAAYCMLTSIFHLIPSDQWQMSIFLKNWAVAGGLLVVSAYAANKVELHHS